MTDFIQTHVSGRAGVITLNRPAALNSLSLAMVRSMTNALHEWHSDRDISAVFVYGQGEKAYCAGGDIRFFHQAALAGDPQLEDFFTEEYTLNHLIHHYPKPYVAFMDGIVMGGGMGLSQGAALRIVTEYTQIALDAIIRENHPELRDHLIAQTDLRMEQYHGAR